MKDMLQKCTGEEGQFVLSDKDVCRIDKMMEIIIDPWTIDFNSKRIKTKLLQLVKEEADEYFYDIFIETKGAICQYAENILDKMMYSVSYDMNIDTMSLIKFLDVRVDIQTDKLIDSLIEYIKLLHDLCKIEVVVLVNIKTYLSQKELLYLYQETLYQKVHLILLEATLTERIDCETIVIIDADKCVIHI